MSVHRVKKNCSICNTTSYFVVSEITIHIDDEHGEPKLLCYKCCKKKFWESDRCKYCSDITMCKDLFLPNMKNAIKSIEGI